MATGICHGSLRVCSVKTLRYLKTAQHTASDFHAGFIGVQAQVYGMLWTYVQRQAVGARSVHPYALSHVVSPSPIFGT
jgi:hypothetical protein